MIEVRLTHSWAVGQERLISQEIAVTRNPCTSEIRGSTDSPTSPGPHPTFVFVAQDGMGGGLEGISKGLLRTRFYIRVKNWSFQRDRTLNCVLVESMTGGVGGGGVRLRRKGVFSLAAAHLVKHEGLHIGVFTWQGSTGRKNQVNCGNSADIRAGGHFANTISQSKVALFVHVHHDVIDVY